ncbi:hypothetical protein [Arthrobacter sp. CG_A4]|uniref:hypothetical protein n=1 Tax=Arthrobacter sp. CG_A4 TaxID=3071706 RepID=UPI002E04FAA5|nr:hypothetical protein [Arthrobacter sp. CG_A4]
MKYRKNDEFSTSLDKQRSKEALSGHFKSLRLRTEETADGLEVHSGSDAMFRLLGPLGTRRIPVGLTIQLEAQNGRTHVKSSAFDRLGWYLNDHLVFGTEEALERKLESLLHEVRSALGEGRQSKTIT